MLRLSLRSLVLAVTMLAPLSAAVADAVRIPNFWDDKEQLEKPDISARAAIRFLTTTDFPPFNFLDADGTLTGFHVDLARAICKELGASDRCQIQALPWDELESALESEKGDAIIAGLAVTAANRATFAFSRSYLRFPARFVSLAKTTFAEPLDKSLGGHRVGVVSGSVHERLLRDYFPNVLVQSYPSANAMPGDLKTGKIDAVFGDGMRLAFWLDSPEAADCCAFLGGPYLSPEYLGEGLAIAFRPGDADLAQAVDFALREITAKGTFAELYLRYFPIGFY